MPSPSAAQLQAGIAALVRTYREAYRRAMLDELPDMTFRQFVYLDTIVRMDQPTSSDVARRFKVTKPAVTAAVTKLISLGYITRVQSQEDRRVYHLVATDKGGKILETEAMVAAEYAASMAECLTPSEQEQFITIAAKITACRTPSLP